MSGVPPSSRSSLLLPFHVAIAEQPTGRSLVVSRAKAGTTKYFWIQQTKYTPGTQEEFFNTRYCTMVLGRYECRRQYARLCYLWTSTVCHVVMTPQRKLSLSKAWYRYAPKRKIKRKSASSPREHHCYTCKMPQRQFTSSRDDDRKIKYQQVSTKSTPDDHKEAGRQAGLQRGRVSPKISVVVLRDKEHCAPAYRPRHGVTKEAFLNDQHAGGAGPAHELVAREKYGVLGHERLRPSRWARRGGGESGKGVWGVGAMERIGRPDCLPGVCVQV